MAVGDSVNALVSKTNGSSLDIQPGASVEWLVHTIIAEQGLAVEIYVGDDASYTNVKKIDTIGGGSVHQLTWRVTNTAPMRIKNVSGSTQFVGYNGVITK